MTIFFAYPRLFDLMKSSVISAFCCLALCSTVAAEAEAIIDFSSTRELDHWAFEVGVAVITENNIGEIFSGNITRGDGPAGGEIYQFKATKTVT